LNLKIVILDCYDRTFDFKFQIVYLFEHLVFYFLVINAVADWYLWRFRYIWLRHGEWSI